MAFCGCNIVLLLYHMEIAMAISVWYNNRTTILALWQPLAMLRADAIGSGETGEKYYDLWDKSIGKQQQCYG